MHFKDKRIVTIETPDDMLTILQEKGNPMKDYKKGTKITVFNKMQQDYSYVLSEAPGKNMAFRPELTPSQILSLGAFEGKYLNDCLLEYPKEWYFSALKNGKLCPGKADPTVNALGVKSRLSLKGWKEYGWLPNRGGHVAKQHPILSDGSVNHDKRGWFEWFCRYYMGRRQPDIDEVQIKRYHAFQRHVAQVRANCKKGDETCRPVQRQALLQWAHNPFI